MEQQGPVVVLDRDDELTDEISVEPTPADPTAGETVLIQQTRYFTAICSFSAGVLHLLAMAAHLDHHPTLGRAFLAVGVLQMVWAGLLIAEPRRIFVALGALLTTGSIVVWVFSRTKGISWFPGMEAVEPLEWRDVVTQFFQLLALAGAVLLLLPASVHRPAGKRVDYLPIAIMGLLAIGALAVLYAATHGAVHVEGGHTH